jgi:hypothetical protein
MKAFLVFHCSGQWAVGSGLPGHIRSFSPGAVFRLIASFSDLCVTSIQYWASSICLRFTAPRCDWLRRASDERQLLPSARSLREAADGAPRTSGSFDGAPSLCAAAGGARSDEQPRRSRRRACSRLLPSNSERAPVCGAMYCNASAVRTVIEKSVKSRNDGASAIWRHS